MLGHGEVRVYRGTGVSRGVRRTTWERSLKNWELQIPCFKDFFCVGNTLGLVPSCRPHSLGYACTFYAPTSPPPNPRYLSSKPKEDKLSRESTNFSRGRPPPHRAGVRTQKVNLCALFSCLNQGKPQKHQGFPSPSLSFLSLFFWKKAGKTHQKNKGFLSLPNP